MEYGRKLLVEGAGDLRFINELARKHGVDLPAKKPYLVEIKFKDGLSSLLNSEFLATEANESDLQILGIMLDADESPNERLAEIREACRKGLGCEIPDSLPEHGLILDAQQARPRFGLWMMPDNSSKGMLETFLAYLVPPDGVTLWDWTEEICDVAKLEKGATFKDVHRDKARIHAYLAFQDEPGRQLHEALINRLLDPDHAMAQKFIAWFCRLYQLTPSLQNRAGQGSA